MLRQISFAATLALLLPGCFSSSTRWRDTRTLEVNVEQNRYVYRLTSLAAAAPTETAYPVISVVPEGAVEVGAISVAVEYSGWGVGGLRRAEDEFYPELAQAAARLGGTHFHVRDTNGDGLIVGMTVSVLRVPPH